MGAPEPIIGEDAQAELLELLDYLAERSGNALLVAERIDRAVARIRRRPEAAPRDPDAPDVPDGSVARKLSVSGYTIRYLYPFRVGGKPHALIVSIRRGSRKVLDDPDYLMRWLDERMKYEPIAELSKRVRRRSPVRRKGTSASIIRRHRDAS